MEWGGGESGVRSRSESGEEVGESCEWRGAEKYKRE